MLSKKDKAYWMWKEKDVVKSLVNIEKLGFIIADDPDFKAYPECLLRRDAAEGLVKARGFLPKGCNFKIYCGWRPWEYQKKCALKAEEMIRKTFPAWPEKKIQEQLWLMAPPQRIVPRLDSHRYGGAVDITVAGKDGKEFNMGVPVDYVKGPESQLLYYELKDGLTAQEKFFRDNRRIIIKAMIGGGFDSYLYEFWHWGYRQQSKI